MARGKSEILKKILKPDVAASLILVVLGILFFADFLFSSKNFYFRDILNFHYPLRRVLIDSYAQGEFPLWNPFIYFGQPMLANPNYLAFYPTNLLHLIFPFNYAFKLHFIIHPIAGGLGIYFLQRRLSIAPQAALGGAIVYQFSGTLLSFLNLYNIVPAVALMPWIGWAFYGALLSPRLKRIILFSFLLAVQVLAFEPLMFCCELLFVAGLALYYLQESSDRRRSAGLIFKTGLAGGGLALAFAAVQVIPTLELLPLSARSQGFESGAGSAWAMHPLDLLNILVPNLYGNPYTIGHALSWGESLHYGREPYLISFFLGSLTILLASLSFCSVRKRLQRTLAGLAALSVVLALGGLDALTGRLAVDIPLLSIGRYPSKFFLLGTLAVAMMAALGLEVMMQQVSRSRSKRRQIFTVALLSLAVSLTLLSGWYYLDSHPVQLESWLRTTILQQDVAGKQFSEVMDQLGRSVLSSGIFLFLGSALIILSDRVRNPAFLGGLLILLVSAELLPPNLRVSPLMTDADVSFVPEVNSHIREYGPREPFRVLSPDEFRPINHFQLRVPNRSSAWLSLYYRMSGRSISGIMQGIQYSIFRSVDHLNTVETEVIYEACMRESEERRTELMAHLNTPIILVLGETDNPNLEHQASFETRSDQKLNLYRLKSTLPRAYWVSRAKSALSSQDALNSFMQPQFPLGQLVILEDHQGRNSRIVCDTESRSPGFLVLLDSHYPGWRAYVDGTETRILKANFAFRAVQVPGGKHQVEFRFEPRSFYAGLFITLLALILAIVIVIVPTLRTRF